MSSTIVSLGRLLDSAALGAFVVVLSGFALYALNLAYYSVTVTHKDKLGVLSNVVKFALPGKAGSLDYNLMHVELFAVIVLLLSMTRAQASAGSSDDGKKRQ